jgi:hypothetical protein
MVDTPCARSAPSATLSVAMPPSFDAAHSNSSACADARISRQSSAFGSTRMHFQPIFSK